MGAIAITDLVKSTLGPKGMVGTYCYRQGQHLLQQDQSQQHHDNCGAYQHRQLLKTLRCSRHAQVVPSSHTPAVGMRSPPPAGPAQALRWPRAVQQLWLDHCQQQQLLQSAQG